MTLEEILKAKGMSEDDITAVIGEMKTNKIFTTEHENMDVRYPKLKADHDNLTAQHGESTKLIEQMKSDAKGNETLQNKITQYESTIANLTEKLKTTQLESAIQVALLGAKATDIDYMTFRMKEKGDLELDEHGQIKNIDDRLAGLKTQYPNFFESASDKKEIQPHQLPNRNEGNDGGMSKAEFLKKPYAERATFANENPEAYKSIMTK